LEHMTMTPRWTQWVEELLLPLMYWQKQLSRTRCPSRSRGSGTGKRFLPVIQAKNNTNVSVWTKRSHIASI
jgi:hypothetical protein